MSSTKNLSKWTFQVAVIVLGTLTATQQAEASSLYKYPWSPEFDWKLTQDAHDYNEYGNWAPQSHEGKFAFDFAPRDNNGNRIKADSPEIIDILSPVEGRISLIQTYLNNQAIVDIERTENGLGTGEFIRLIHLTGDSVIEIGLTRGESVSQGQELGELFKGKFSKAEASSLCGTYNDGTPRCPYGSGTHLHIEFPAADYNYPNNKITGEITIDGNVWMDNVFYPAFETPVSTSTNWPFDAQEAVEQIYQDVLSRPADPGGLEAYVKAIENDGRTLEWVRQDIANSPESMENINTIYLEVLGREVDSGTSENGLERHINSLAGGTSLGEVRAEVANTPESRDNINQIYQQKAGRDATSQEIERSVESLAVGATVGDGNKFTVQDVEWAAIREVSLFPDVPRNYVFADDIYDLVSDGVVSGYENGYFQPEIPVNRGEFAKFITSAFGYETNTSCGAFPDVPFGSPFYNEITTLKCNGIVNGNNGLYLPEDDVKRAEATVFLVNGFNNLVDDTLELKRTYDKEPFSDIGHLVEGFQDLIMTTYENGIFNGDNGEFKPDNPLERGQASTVVNRTRNLLETTQANNQDGALEPDKTFDFWKYFTFVSTGLWFDPPTSYGFEFDALGDTLFTDILDFPTGIDSDGSFTVSVGDEEIGVFGAGQSVDFVSLLGEGVSNFLITDIDPLPGNDITDFAVQLAFNEEIGSFRMRPIDEETQSVPEPSSVLGLLAFGALGSLTWRKRKQQRGG